MLYRLGCFAIAIQTYLFNSARHDETVVVLIAIDAGDRESPVMTGALSPLETMRVAAALMHAARVCVATGGFSMTRYDG